MNRKLRTFFLALYLVPTLGLAMLRISPGVTTPTQFAIITDSLTYSKIPQAIQAYRDAVERDGLATTILAAAWQSPEIIRAEIQQLASQKTVLEGVVLVGDVPIPMIRDAQHLASAFKMNQERFPYIRSSVPSDRFYDDFDLRFDFIEQDTTNPLLFYYSLRADSPQRIDKDIYSGRIKAPTDGPQKYDLLEKYLLRIAGQKQSIEILDQVLTYNGHGYHSEALSAWESQSLALREQLPDVYRSGQSIKSLYHSMTYEMKGYLFSELEQEALDLAIFHAHGGTQAQYIQGLPAVSGTVKKYIDPIRLYLRGRLRRAKRRNQSLEEAKAELQSQHHFPDEWFEGAFDDSVMVADSIFWSQQDIYSEDLENISPQAEVIIFDQCFTGAFFEPSYLAGSYLFGTGSVVAGVANSVNVKQDIWSDEFIGLLAEGVRLGNWHRFRNDLENHIIGDPTFRYAAEPSEPLNRALSCRRNAAGYWKRKLNSRNPNLRSLAIHLLFDIEGREMETSLVDIYHHDPSFIVRLQALKSLARLRTPAFEEILLTSIRDPYELIRRITATWMGVIGKEEYIAALIEPSILDNSRRVQYQAAGAIEKIDPAKGYQLTQEFLSTLSDPFFREKEQQSANWNYPPTEKSLRTEIIPALQSDTLSTKERLQTIRRFRNYQYQAALPDLLALAENNNEELSLRIATLEALGWFAFSHNREQILASCDAVMAASAGDSDLYQEALKTRKRIIAGSNDPLNP